jgi:hypothetical protein
MKEAYPLQWPSDWIRTRIQDRREQKAWKKTLRQFRDALEKELKRAGAISFVLSTNVPIAPGGGFVAGPDPRDPGVAVYFSRPQKEDYSWQDILGIHEPDPSAERIRSAYLELTKKYHTDVGGDKEMFLHVTRARDMAMAWHARKEGQTHDLVIACDAFKEVRWNVNAIRMTIAAIRQIERCGTSSLLERAFKGFAALPEGRADVEQAAAAR